MGRGQDAVGADCGHVFCRACVADYTATCAERALCPACRKPLSVNFEEAAPVRPRAQERPAAARRGTSTLIQFNVHAGSPHHPIGRCWTAMGGVLLTSIQCAQVVLQNRHLCVMSSSISSGQGSDMLSQ